MNVLDQWLAAALYLPLTLAVIAGLLRQRTLRLFAACLLSTLWVLTGLLALQSVNLRVGWWSFPYGEVRFNGMPVELYLGWAVLWGILPILVFHRLPAVWGVTALALLDLLVMPLCGPVVHLGKHWIWGEILAIGVVLTPALCLARWTLMDEHLEGRASFQVILSGAVFLFLLPAIAFELRPGIGWQSLFTMNRWMLQFALQGVMLLALPGVSAVMEFCERGRGTPLPYDSPMQLVQSGIYRYIANPMQVSCTLAMLAWAGLLHNTWLLLVPLTSFVYSAGLASWDEEADLEERFGKPWLMYRRKVQNWIPRWKPYCAAHTAKVYVAATCEPCSEVGRWIRRHRPTGLDICNAEMLPYGSILRMRYDAQDGSEPVEGVRAMARVLEHINLGWALAGAALRLPMVWQFAQLLMDASGLGPRAIPGAQCNP